MIGLSGAVAGAVKEKEEREAKQKLKNDTDNVGKLIVNTDLLPSKIAEIAGTSIDFVHKMNETLPR